MIGTFKHSGYTLIEAEKGKRFGCDFKGCSKKAYKMYYCKECGECFCFKCTVQIVSDLLPDLDEEKRPTKKQKVSKTVQNAKGAFNVKDVKTLQHWVKLHVKKSDGLLALSKLEKNMTKKMKDIMKKGGYDSLKNLVEDKGFKAVKLINHEGVQTIKLRGKKKKD